MTIWHVPNNYLTTVWTLMTAYVIAVMLKLCCFITFEISDNVGDKNYDLIRLPSAARRLKTAKINYSIMCSYFEQLNQLPSLFLVFWSHKWKKRGYNSPTIYYKIISVFKNFALSILLQITDLITFIGLHWPMLSLKMRPHWST